MRSTCEPICSTGKSGFTTPPALATAAAEFGNHVRAPIGRLLLKYSSCAQLPPQYGPTVQLLVPAMEKNVEPPPVTGSLGKLFEVVLWPSKLRRKRSVTSHLALKPSESSLYSCSWRCCS